LRGRIHEVADEKGQPEGLKDYLQDWEKYPLAHIPRSDEIVKKADQISM
jgi:hypothetical protein